MKITTTLPPGGGDHEDHGAVVRFLPAADVSERPVDEGGNELDRRGSGEGDPQTGDPNVDPPDPGDRPEDADEDDLLWMRLGLQPDRGRIDVVISDWRRIKGQINVAWQSLHQAIVDASQGHRRISREEHYLRAEVELLTHMSLPMLRRAELLLSFDAKVELGTEYQSPKYKYTIITIIELINMN